MTGGPLNYTDIKETCAAGERDFQHTLIYCIIVPLDNWRYGMARAYKYYFIFLGSVLTIVLILILTNRLSRNAASQPETTTDTYQIISVTAEPTPTKASELKSNSTKINFTNKFGTATTKCNHPGCTNTIAPSGDTNCCTIHSQKCIDCGCYIDEDAIWCIDCILDALEEIEKNN